MFLKTSLAKYRSILCKIRNKTRISNKTTSIQHYFLCFSALSVVKIVQKENNKRYKEERNKSVSIYRKRLPK